LIGRVGAGQCDDSCVGTTGRDAAVAPA